MGKRIVVFLLALCLISISLYGCSGRAEITVGGTKVSNDVTAYFKTLVKEGEDIKPLASRYVAVNSEFKNKGLSVPASKRAALSEKVNDLWHLYGSYYESKGISKETIYKIELSKVYETLLLEERYSENGESPLSESDIKAYFRDNYASIRFVTGYLFDVDENGTTEMTEAQKNALTSSFNAAATAINGGTDISEAISLLGSPEIHSAVVSSTDSGSFPDGFFDAVKKLDTNKSAAIVLGSYVFLVQRMDAEDGEYECYSEYRSDCLYQMKGEEFEKIVEDLAKQYK